MVKLLLDHGADPNLHGPLMTARWHEGIVKLLLERGANPNTEGAIWKVAEEGRIRVVKLLLDAGADMTIIGAWDLTVLQAAASKGREDVVKLLIDRGADPNLHGPLMTAHDN